MKQEKSKFLDKLQHPIGQSHPWNPVLAPFISQAHLFSALQMLYKHSFVYVQTHTHTDFLKHLLEELNCR